ncbi:MAG: sulfatase, partial [Candidatus Nanohaloarchaea archaeon]
MKTLLVTVDSLRRDHIGYHGYERDTTPFLDSLARDNLVFEECYSASCHTREAVPPILTGKHPENCLDRYELQAETIAEKLGKNGVKTTAFLTAPYLIRANCYHRGFDEFYSDYRFGYSNLAMQLEYVYKVFKDRHYGTGLPMNQKVAEAVTRAEETFTWAHYMDVHQPYNKFDEWRWGEKISPRRLQLIFRKAKHFPLSLTKKEREILVDAYDNSVRRFDETMEDLFSRIPDDTKVFIVADHGESLGEDGNYEHRRHLRDELIEVPLIVRNGDSGTVEQPVSTTDIAPTIADIYGVDMETEGARLDSREDRDIRASCRRMWK